MHVHGHLPSVQQPFRHIASIFVLKTPVLELERRYVIVLFEPQLTNLDFERGDNVGNYP